MPRIRLSENFRAVFYGPFYATLALGHCATEGVDVELVPSPAPAAATAGLADGSLDVSWGGPMRAMKSRNDPGSVQLTCFCDVVRRDPFYLVARPGLGSFALADLPCLRFASVSEVPTPWLCLQHDLRLAGIDPGSVPRVADRTMADNLAALARGDLDVAQMFEPFAAQAERTGQGTIVHAASARGDTAYTTFLATPASLARNRDAFAALSRAVARTQAWITANGSDALAHAVADFYPGINADDLAAAYRRYLAAGLWATDTAVSRAGYQRLGESLQSGRFIERIPAYEDCVVSLA